MKVFSITDVGRIRQMNQDYVFATDEPLGSLPNLLVVADGMGGHKAGDFASKFTVETLKEELKLSLNEGPKEVLMDAVQVVNHKLIQTAETDIKLDGMGTTLVAATVIDHTLYFINVGDSRLYLINKDIKQISRDHSLVEEMLRLGGISEEEAKNHPQKNVITRAMQPCQERRAKVSIAHLTDIQEGDYFYMCSDGMLEQSTDDNILNIITKKDAKNEQKVEMLRNVTEDNKDNHTAHLIYINKVEGKVPVAVATKPSMPQGVWVTPLQEKPKNKKMIVLIAAGVALLVAIVAGVLFFMNPFADKQNTEEQKEDTVKTEINEPQHKVEQAAPSQVEEEKEQET